MDVRMDVLVNIVTNAAMQIFLGVTNMIGALIILLVALPLGCFVWHRQRIKNGKTGVESSHIISIGLVGMAIFSAVTAGAYMWQQFLSPIATQRQAASQLIASTNDLILNAGLREGGFGASESPLILTGTYAGSGKSIKFAIDVSLDTQNRGQSLRRVPRIKIGEVPDFVSGQAVNVVVVSYFNHDRSAPMWGKRRLLSGIDDETFQFTSFVKAAVFAIDENGRETRILGFTLLPKISGADFMNERVNRAPPTWRNLLVYPDGSLQKLDSIQ
jgi:hypothetical protein